MLRLTVVAVLLLALASCGTSDSSSDGRVIRTDASYAFDPSDPQALVGASTEIFFGKVVSGSADAIYPNGDTLPLTEFRVATTDIVKGDPGINRRGISAGGEDQGIRGQDVI